MCIYAHMHAGAHRGQKRVRFPGAGAPDMGWERNLGPPQEKQVLLNHWASPQQPHPTPFSFWFKISLCYPDWSWTCDCPALGSKALALQACSIIQTWFFFAHLKKVNVPRQLSPLFFLSKWYFFLITFFHITFWFFSGFMLPVIIIFKLPQYLYFC